LGLVGKAKQLFDAFTAAKDDYNDAEEFRGWRKEFNIAQAGGPVKGREDVR